MIHSGEFGIWKSILGSQFWGVDFWVLVLTFDSHPSLQFLDLLEFPLVGLLYLLLSVGYLSLPLKKLLELDKKSRKKK